MAPRVWNRRDRGIRSDWSVVMAGLTIRIYINDNKRGTARREVLAETTKANRKTLRVRLPDGNVIKRSRKRDVV